MVANCLAKFFSGGLVLFNRGELALVVVSEEVSTNRHLGKNSGPISLRKKK